MKTLERLIYYIEQNNGKKEIRKTKLLSMLKDVQREHEELRQVKSVDLADVVGRSEQLPEYELGYCENCMQMTNHLNGICQKCK